MPQPDLQDRRPAYKPPLLHPTTRLALYAGPASGILVVQGFEAAAVTDFATGAMRP